MPTSSCLSSCREHLISFISEIPDLYEKVKFNRNGNHRTGVSSVMLSISIARVTLLEIKKMFAIHPLSLDSEDLCDKAYDLVLKMMGGIDPEDQKFLDQLHEVGLYDPANSLFTDHVDLTKGGPIARDSSFLQQSAHPPLDGSFCPALADITS